MATDRHPLDVPVTQAQPNLLSGGATPSAGAPEAFDFPLGPTGEQAELLRKNEAREAREEAPLRKMHEESLRMIDQTMAKFSAGQLVLNEQQVSRIQRAFRGKAERLEMIRQNNLARAEILGPLMEQQIKHATALLALNADDPKTKAIRELMVSSMSRGQGLMERQTLLNHINPLLPEGARVSGREAVNFISSGQGLPAVADGGEVDPLDVIRAGTIIDGMAPEEARRVLGIMNFPPGGIEAAVSSEEHQQAATAALAAGEEAAFIRPDVKLTFTDAVGMVTDKLRTLETLPGFSKHIQFVILSGAVFDSEGNNIWDPIIKGDKQLNIGTIAWKDLDYWHLIAVAGNMAGFTREEMTRMYRHLFSVTDSTSTTDPHAKTGPPPPGQSTSSQLDAALSIREARAREDAEEAEKAKVKAAEGQEEVTPSGSN